MIKINTLVQTYKILKLLDTIYQMIKLVSLITRGIIIFRSNYIQPLPNEINLSQ